MAMSWMLLVARHAGAGASQEQIPPAAVEFTAGTVPEGVPPGDLGTTLLAQTMFTYP
eukprot:CAMPEP_0169338768 /NCGR_PEP_ID=MMETSP1017-20121227/18093_1 /TAXON_ID=342587 /ORGANISM="Karlodinium micrum, Strain CCMP2283" /LENGTH=56 /DNA_ID=CAMNT_0009434327 /DNA_START=230 /DNA_END=397 /DNA_ORIENTATION=-